MRRRQWERLEIEYDNLRAALRWSLGGGGTEIGVRLAGALGDFWGRRGYLSEGRGWLASALAQSDIATVARAKVLAQAAAFAGIQGDYLAAHTQLETSVRLYRELGCLSEVAEVLNAQGRAALDQGDEKGWPEGAVRLLAAAEAWFEVLGHVLDPTEREEHDHYLVVARAQLDEESFEAAWAEGRALTLEQATAEVLAATNKVPGQYLEGN